MSPVQEFDDSTATQREPAVIIITAAIVLLNALLAVLFSFVTLSPGQVAAIYGLSNPIGALAAAIAVRGRVAPWQPIDLPDHAVDLGYDPEADAPAHGL